MNPWQVDSVKNNKKHEIELLHEVEEGPYYKTGSPQRNSISAENTFGKKLVLEGQVLDLDGNPVSGAWVDFWHADGKGKYDNTGYNLRGHQYTDIDGKFHLETIMPALYGNRTPHIHVKVQANPRSKIYTSQLYFPQMNSNERDPIFEPANVMELTETAGITKARYDLVVEVTY